MKETTLILKDSETIKAFSALADKYRLMIVNQLFERNSMTCSDAKDLIGLSQPTTSHHIKILSESGIINCNKDGRVITMTINKEMINSLALFFENLK